MGTVSAHLQERWTKLEELPSIFGWSFATCIGSGTETNAVQHEDERVVSEVEVELQITVETPHAISFPRKHNKVTTATSAPPILH